MIRIQCPQNDFRRGGVAHPKGETFYREDYFGTDSLAAIEAEKKLAVAKGLKPTGPDMMSVAELQAALAKAKVEYADTDPWELLVSRYEAAKTAKDSK
jgi:hypothetical protein